MDKFCLKSNDYETNIRDFFRKIREDHRFFDVTLVTDDGKHVQAHKLILSAGSNVFSDIFMKSNQSNMLVYLKGTRSDVLEPIIDFLYNGEAFITQEQLKVFIDTGKEWQVKGLDGEMIGVAENKKKKPTDPDDDGYDYLETESVFTGFPDDVVAKIKVLIETGKLMHVRGIESELTEEVAENNYNDNEDNIVFPLSGEHNEDTIAELKEENLQPRFHYELKSKINEMIEKYEDAWRCRKCGRTSLNKSNLRTHVETHIEGMSYACHICSKTFLSRPRLSTHISGIHSQLFSCDICGKTGMNRMGYRNHRRKLHN